MIVFLLLYIFGFLYWIKSKDKSSIENFGNAYSKTRFE